MFSFVTLRDALRTVSTLLFAGIILILLPAYINGAAVSPWWALIAGGWLFLEIKIILNPDLGTSPSIWFLQDKLMHMSGQGTPRFPVLTRQAFMYWAITLEELAETGHAMASALNTKDAGYKDIRLSLLEQRMRLLAVELDRKSNELRQEVAKIPEAWEHELPRHRAIPIFDGVVDATVTIAGLGVTLGLPCQGGYEEVQRSNMSKANPSTGKIDKDPSGKWIKGPGYFPPDLGRLLDLQWRGIHKEL